MNALKKLLKFMLYFGEGGDIYIYILLEKEYIFINTSLPMQTHIEIIHNMILILI